MGDSVKHQNNVVTVT